MDTNQFLSKIKESVKHFDNDAEVILFGSRARKDHSSFSDWDFLILLNCSAEEVMKEQIRDELFEVELESEQVISTIIHSKSNWTDLSITPLYENIKKEGIRI